MRRALLAPLVALALVFLPGAYVGPPVPMGAWTAFTPSLSASSGTITTRGASASRYQLVGKTLYLAYSETITTNGTGAGSINIGLPPGMSTAAEVRVRGWEAVTNKPLIYAAASGQTTLSIYTESIAYPGSDGARFDLNVVVEIQ